MLLFLLSLFSAVFAQTVTDTPTPTLTPVPSLTPTQTLTPTAIPPTNTPTLTPSPTPTVGPFKLTVVSVSSQIVKNTPFTVSVKLENTQVGTTYALKAYATNNTSLISTQNNLIWYGYTGAWASMPFVVGNGGLINTSLTARIEEIQLPSTLRVRANKNYSGTLAESDNTIAITTVLEPTSTPTNTPTPTATPTNSPVPTNTPTPTHTPTPTPTATPSPTPLPTITDFPTDTPAPTITPAYLIQTLDSNVLGAQDTAQLETKFMVEDSNPSTLEPGFNLTKILPIILIVTGGLVLLVPLFLSILKKNG